ncbi:NlpB/DapX lipoprotein [Agitococcus lubricus]|uniref:NlpB/DapX lipoprotein n=1 Tax=Agitococcus lubricus TaxID=1077255 RepID=A0A2T5IX89_9GAMM|nr:NlpB/DapX lipoprotein [Agitococcus lubricus]
MTLGACSLLPETSLDYQKSPMLAPLVLTEGQTTRPIQPLFAIPDVTTPAENVAVVTEGKGRKQHFAAPLPKPLAIAEVKNAAPIKDSPLKPIIVKDGNNHPVLQTAGDIRLIWDDLERVLTKANIKISDRNQSLGLYFVELSEKSVKQLYQLKLTRTSNDNVISLQKDDDTLADAVVSQRLFETLLTHWPNN